MEQENINALDEIHKGACMGVDAINFTIEQVEEEKLKNELEKQKEDYQKIAREIEKIYPKYNNDEPHKTSAINKVMTWSSIEMKTMNDKSSSKISEMLIQGINMGIIEGKKILNKKNINEEVSDIVNKYVTMQEKNLDTLKEYL